MRVAIVLSTGLGDVLSQLRAVLNYQKKTKYKVTAVIQMRYIGLFAGHPAYENIKFMSWETAKDLHWDKAIPIPIVIDGDWRLEAPVDPKTVGMIEYSAAILEVPVDHEPPPIAGVT